MGKWATALKYGCKYGGKIFNNSATRTVGNAVIHPQRTLMGAGTAMKNAVVGGGLGYVAWEGIVNDKPVVRTAADMLVGEETVDKGLEMAGNAADRVEKAVDKAGDALNGVNNSVSSLGDSFGGVSSFLKNVSGGNGLDMMGNFFGNLGKGNVSGLSIMGLLASALLIFGRFGWLGKIAGAVLGMMLIGNNSKVQQAPVPQQNEETARQGGMRR